MQNAVPTSLPPGLMVIEEIISPEEERRMLEIIDWKGDEDIQNGGYSYRNPDVLYFQAGLFFFFFCSFRLQEVYILVNLLSEMILCLFLAF